MRSRLLWLFIAFIVSLSAPSSAQQNNPADVHPVPPLGIPVPDADRAELEMGIAALGKEINELREALKKQPVLLALLPDVQIFHNAARYALHYNEFFKPAEIAAAKAQLKQGLQRAAELRAGKTVMGNADGLDCARLCF